MSTVTQHGYLVLADISGYTSFVAKTELEHSHEILTELLELLVENIKPVMTISKLEGDAVFAYASEEVFSRGETMLEFIETIYVAFRDRQLSMRRKTTCTCNACRNIPSLDLKFIIHCGEFIVQNISNVRELVGSDVNLIHRLSKNHVSEATGWRAYMMFTEICLERLKLTLEDTHIQMEEYEHVGEVKTLNVDLHKRYTEITENRRVFLEEKDADFTLQIDFPVPPAIAWEWFQDPLKRNIWNGGHVTWSAGDRPKGRSGAGASNHCAHGRGVSTEIARDWRPFEYSTADSYEKGKLVFTETIRFEPRPDGGTRVVDILKMHSPMPSFLRKFMLRFVLINQHQFDKHLREAAQLARQEFERAQKDTTPYES